MPGEGAISEAEGCVPEISESFHCVGAAELLIIPSIALLFVPTQHRSPLGLGLPHPRECRSHCRSSHLKALTVFSLSDNVSIRAATAEDTGAEAVREGFVATISALAVLPRPEATLFRRSEAQSLLFPASLSNIALSFDSGAPSCSRQ